MIKPYFGEFLIIPMPLELSLERCSNACHYCFSNLNGYQMKQSFKSVLNHLANFGTRKDHGSLLLRHGYSLCFSNRSDPFCTSNYRNSIALCEIFAGLGIGIAFQTKGGKGIDEVLSFMPSSIWYITIAQDDDDIRKKIEPNTISIKERLKLIEKLVENGHLVNVGINPYVPEWVKDKKGLVNDIASAGAYGITAEGLHFSHEQIRRMKPGGIEKKIIKRALKRTADNIEIENYKILKDIILNSGLEFMSFWNEHVTHLLTPYYQYYNCFPVVTNFTNWLIENKKEGDLITFDDFCNVMTGLPNVEFKIDSYVLSVNRSFKDKNIPVYGTARELLKLFWSHPQFKSCPANHPHLGILARYIDKKTVELTDDLPVYIYHKRGIKSVYINEYGEGIC